MRIREASTDDVEAIGRVHALARGAAYAGLVPAEALALVTPERQAVVWRTRMSHADGPSAFLVAEVDGKVVGFTHGTADGEDAELHAIHVLPEQQGTGVAQALHDRLLDELRSWGCSGAHLYVLRGNERAQSFYRRNDWVHDGTTSSHEVGGAVVPILRYARAL